MCAGAGNSSADGSPVFAGRRREDVCSGHQLDGGGVREQVAADGEIVSPCCTELLIVTSHTDAFSHRPWDCYLSHGPRGASLRHCTRYSHRPFFLRWSLAAHVDSVCYDVICDHLSFVLRSLCESDTHTLPHVGSRVVRMDLLRFLARCRTRRLNQV